MKDTRKISGGLAMQNDLRYILNLTVEEIKHEIRTLLKKPDLEPPDRSKIGYIADSETEYVDNGIVDQEKLKGLYCSSKYIDQYIMTLAINSIRNRKKDLFELINNQNWDNTVLDYGCGTGTHGIACAQNGARVCFYDISETMLQVTVARVITRQIKYTYIIRNEDILLENAFTTILCTDVLEHVVNPEKTIEKFIKWLQIGGIAHIHISLGKSYERGHLPESIDKWETECLPLIKKHFKQISENNYELVRK
jgi:ubiquinone/menaquinone biosynthesis C-methylase UbiE